MRWINNTTLTFTQRLSRVWLLTKHKQSLHRSTENRCDKIPALIRGNILSYSKPSFGLNSKLPKSSFYLANVNLLQRRYNNAQGKHAASDETSYISKYVQIWRKNPLPIWVGLLLIAGIQYRRLSKEKRETELPNLEPVEAQPMPIWLVQAYERMPLDVLSRLVGYILNDITLPEWARKPIISWYAATFQCRIFEAEKGDEWNEYKTLGEFFRRRLKKDARPINQSSNLTSPCDGRVLSCGPIDKSGKLEQVKGASYMLKDFLGNYFDDYDQSVGIKETIKSEMYNYVPKEHTRLYQCTLYLAPGDYHCFHAPANWTVNHRKHFTGKLLSVGPFVMGKIPHLMSLNERVVYFGKWYPDINQQSDADGYFFAFAAVGATNVGSIKVEIDDDLKTNLKGKFKKDKLIEEQCFNYVQSAKNIQKGAYFGEFNLGSSIVLIMEAPLDFTFDVQNGEKVFVGQPLDKRKK